MNYSQQPTHKREMVINNASSGVRFFFGSVLVIAMGTVVLTSLLVVSDMMMALEIPPGVGYPIIVTALSVPLFVRFLIRGDL